MPTLNENLPNFEAKVTFIINCDSTSRTVIMRTLRNIEITNLVCLDLGASTGGFTEVLLSKKVKKIYAVDVGSNQLHEKLKNDSRIINISKTNARYLSKKIIHDIVDIIVCDVSFISMKKVIQPTLQFLNKDNGQ